MKKYLYLATSLFLISNSYAGPVVSMSVPIGNSILMLQSSFLVPSGLNIPKLQTVFIWPGLSPNSGKNFLPLGQGVLQPVLTRGPSCAPHSVSVNNGWWISGQYVNSTNPNFFHKAMVCLGGKAMKLSPGDDLTATIQFVGGEWVQTIADFTKMETTSYTLSLSKLAKTPDATQAQHVAYFVIELPYYKDFPNLGFATKFGSISITLKNSDPNFKNSIHTPPGTSCTEAYSEDGSNDKVWKIDSCSVNSLQPTT